MWTLAIATFLHYFGIFTFHTGHYWACLFIELLCCGTVSKSQKHQETPKTNHQNIKITLRQRI